MLLKLRKFVLPREHFKCGQYNFSKTVLWLKQYICVLENSDYSLTEGTAQFIVLKKQTMDHLCVILENGRSGWKKSTHLTRTSMQDGDHKRSCDHCLTYHQYQCLLLVLCYLTRFELAFLSLTWTVFLNWLIVLGRSHQTERLNLAQSFTGNPFWKINELKELVRTTHIYIYSNTHWHILWHHCKHTSQIVRFWDFIS